MGTLDIREVAANALGVWSIIVGLRWLWSREQQSRAGRN